MLNIFKNKREEKHDHDAKIFNYDRINENIFIGNNMCCSAMLDEMLVKEGIYADISLEEKFGRCARAWVRHKLKPDTTSSTISRCQFQNSRRLLRTPMRRSHRSEERRVGKEC